MKVVYKVWKKAISVVVMVSFNAALADVPSDSVGTFSLGEYVANLNREIQVIDMKGVHDCSVKLAANHDAAGRVVSGEILFSDCPVAVANLMRDSAALILIAPSRNISGFVDFEFSISDKPVYTSGYIALAGPVRQRISAPSSDLFNKFQEFEQALGEEVGSVWKIGYPSSCQVEFKFFLRDFPFVGSPERSNCPEPVVEFITLELRKLEVKDGQDNTSQQVIMPFSLEVSLNIVEDGGAADYFDDITDGMSRNLDEIDEENIVVLDVTMAEDLILSDKNVRVWRGSGNPNYDEKVRKALLTLGGYPALPTTIPYAVIRNHKLAF